MSSVESIIKLPGLVIGGTNSGCGKTTVAMGIMAALTNKGLKVQPYKAGPDYIDPMFHTFITGRKSRNLDSWMLDEQTVRYLYAKSAVKADISIVEGVMGLYDGYGVKTDEGSTAHVSKILKLPIVLVIDGKAMSLSVAAMVKGFVDFDKSLDISGVIVNNVSSNGHYKILKQAIEENTKIPVLGYLPRMSELAIKERHLGLVASVEIGDLDQKIKTLANCIQQTVDIDRLAEIANQSGEFDVKETTSDVQKIGNARIAVAKDTAFNFYYEDNLELLEIMGAELVFFSPMYDEQLPDDIDGLYIGGGYPEVRANKLSSNVSIRNDIKHRIEEGLPTYAECGGFMYLTDSIEELNGKKFEMVGVINGKSMMTDSLKRFGYVFVKMTQDNILGKKGMEIKAHEFHYSRTDVSDELVSSFDVSKRKNGIVTRSWNCGFKVNNLVAGYVHIHFWANLDIARNFIESCIRNRKQG